MKYWGIALVSSLFLVVPMSAQDEKGADALEQEITESVVTIRTLLSEDGEEVPSLITIFTEDEENPVMSGMRTEFQLPPGEYRVRAKARDVVVTESLVVPEEGEADLILVLDAGYLQLRSIAVEDGEELETYYNVFKAEGPLPEKRKRFTAGGSGDFLLPAGKYVVSSKWGSAEVEGTFEVVPNEITKGDLILNAGSLVLTTSLAEGGEEVQVYYDVYEVGTALDGSRKRVAGGSSGRFQVPAGKYLLTTTWGRAKTDQEIEVVAGEMTRTGILMPAGLLNVTSRNAAGEPVEPFLTIYKAEKLIDGSRKRVSAGTTSDHQLLVGDYVVEGEIDGERVTVETVVKPGERTEVVLAPDPLLIPD